MKNQTKLLTVISFLLLGILYSCSENTSTEVQEAEIEINFQDKKVYKYSQIKFDNQFDGARLNHIEQIDDNSFLIQILPENEPINKSPWFSFRITSEEDNNISITLQYPNFAHRYIPKLSYDKLNWENITNVNVDNVNNEAQFNVALKKGVQYISAQEIFDSKENHKWSKQVAQDPDWTLNSYGKSVQDRYLYVLENIDEETKETLIFIARQHPPEIPGSTIAYRAFQERIMEKDSLAQAFMDRFNILSYPLINPDGVDLGHWRHNVEGVDLNRDWVAFNQTETKLTRNHITNTVTKNDLEVVFAIDFHTSFSGPYLLVEDSLSNRANKGIIDAWETALLPFQTDAPLDFRHRSQELPYCYNWFINTFDCEAVTYEEGDEIERTIVKERAEYFAETLMEILLEKY